MSVAKRIWSGLVPPLAWGALVLLAWEWLVKWRHIKPFVLPAPSAIWRQFGTNRTGIVETAKATGTNALIGLVLGALLAVGVAFIAQRFGLLRLLRH
jgi:NitT/TauT family transport system permease protein